MYGGPKGDRTPDLQIANLALSHVGRLYAPCMQIMRGRKVLKSSKKPNQHNILRKKGNQSALGSLVKNGECLIDKRK